MVRSTKKVKPAVTAEEPMCQEEEMPQRTLAKTEAEAVKPPKVLSFRDMVLHSGTQPLQEDVVLELSNEDILKLVAEELGPDLKQNNEEAMPLLPSILNLKPRLRWRNMRPGVSLGNASSSSVCWEKR